MPRALGQADAGRATRALLEVVLVVSAASAVVALLETTAPSAGLGVIYLPAVLLIAIRRGQVAALVTSMLSVGTFNFLFIEPRFRLTIASSGDVVVLAVFLIVAVVVSRLAATARERARLGEQAALAAAAREREANVVAEAASSVLADAGPSDSGDRLEILARAVAGATESAVEVVIGSRPADLPGSVIAPLPNPAGSVWLRGQAGFGWDFGSLSRLAEPLAHLIAVARERDRLASERAEREAARRADVAKTALLHAVSHDLRSPLTAISTAASGLGDRHLSEDDGRSLLTVIQEEADRLARLVDDLLDLSRIEAGAVDPQLDWCHLNEVAMRAVGQIRRRREHPIEVELPDDVLLVQADPVQLERVFYNLLDNAVKYSPENVPVRLSGGVGGGHVQVRITDGGRGIPLSRRSQVFEPFFRGRGESEGSGLGLAICRGFVEANGGQIRITDDGRSGTSFSVSFPLARQPSLP